MSDPDTTSRSGREDSVDVPTVQLSAIEPTARLIHLLQSIILKHPIAANAAYRALISEGLLFAQTPEGLQWRQKLAGSELLHRARLVLDLPGLSMLDLDRKQTLPSSYLDAVFMLASSRKPDELLDLLFKWSDGNYGN
jgi:hypothetical protein